MRARESRLLTARIALKSLRDTVSLPGLKNFPHVRVWVDSRLFIFQHVLARGVGLTEGA